MNNDGYKTQAELERKLEKVEDATRDVSLPNLGCKDM